MPQPLLAVVALSVAITLGPAAKGAKLHVEVVMLDHLPAAAGDRVTQKRPGMLPDGRIVRGGGTIRAAWFVGPTRRYAHGVLGDAIEASGLAVETAGGAVLSLALDDDAVFEDVVPRLVDLDGDGRDEVLVIKTTMTKGAALALAAVRDGRLAIIAEGEPIGRPRRWLNPVGIGDFDGDGRVETAHVETPHIGGTLVLSRMERGRLVVVRRARGFSNHRLWSRELGLSSVLDADGDRVPDLVVPDDSRTRLRVVSFAGGPMRELARLELGAEIASLRLADVDGDGRRDVTFRLSDGRVGRLLFRP